MEFPRFPDFGLCKGRADSQVNPYPLRAWSARPNPKVGAPDPETPSFLGFSVLGRGLRPWSQTMVSGGASHGVGVDPETFKKNARSFKCWDTLWEQFCLSDHSSLMDLAPRKRFATAEKLRFFIPRPQKIAAISSAMFWRFFCDFLRQNLRFCISRFENAAVLLRLRFLGRKAHRYTLSRKLC